ncbi:MAG: carbohydrate kinase family protein [Candidatus Zambryskibacteria bacterium]|nr:carbohydrate kinase family protein [Candidatus Zambryskibacteria bacterium]
MDFFNKKDFDFVSIGDITTDAFIRLKDAKVNRSEDGQKQNLIIKFGDKVEYEFMEEVRAVGNSANAAVCAARLGLKSAHITDLGDDYNGHECIATLKKNGVDTDLVSIHKDKLTNYHYVLWFEDDRTILVKHESYDYKLPNLGKPKWIYLTSIGENSGDYHNQIAEYLRNNQEIKLAFQPGTFQMKMGTEVLKNIYARTDIFFCNVEEAKRILNKQEENIDIKDLLKMIHDIGPNVAVITDGPKGAYAYDGYEGFSMRPYPDEKPPYDRTGAGDAFSATFASAIALGKSLFDAFLWAPVNSMSVVQYVGAQKGLLTQERILQYLSRAPEDYKPQKIM